MRIKLGLAGSMIALAIAAPSAHATLLPGLLVPTGTLVVPPTDCLTSNTAAQCSNGSGSPVGTKVADTGVVSFTGIDFFHNVNYTGQFREVVYKEAQGTLDFYLQFSNDPSSPGGITQMNTSIFKGFLTYGGTDSAVSLLGACPGGSCVDPGSDGVNKTGVTITWNYLGIPVDPGEMSYTMLVSTNALNYQAGQVSFQGDASGVTTLSAYEPGPEPAGIVLFGTAFALTAFLLRKKFKSQA